MTYIDDFETKTKNNMIAHTTFQAAVNGYDDYLKSIGIAKQQRMEIVSESARTAILMCSLNE